MIISQHDADDLNRQLGNLAARMFTERRFADFGAVKAAMAIIVELAAAAPPAPAPEKPRRGRGRPKSPETNGAAGVAADGGK